MFRLLTPYKGEGFLAHPAGASLIYDEGRVAVDQLILPISAHAL
jgi:hypothetical protein